MTVRSTIRDQGMRQTQDEYFGRLRADRADKVLAAACKIAEKYGLAYVTKRVVSDHAGCATGTVLNAFGSMTALHDAVLREAIKRPMLRTLAQGLAAGHPVAQSAPEDLKRQALAAVS